MGQWGNHDDWTRRGRVSSRRGSRESGGELHTTGCERIHVTSTASMISVLSSGWPVMSPTCTMTVAMRRVYNFACACIWIRDVHEEGIEPHPGPPARVLSKNLNGVQGPNKLWKFLRTLSNEHKKAPIFACMVQEHNLKSEDREEHQKTARFFRILAVISYSASAEERGGTAVFIPYSSIEENEGETDDQARARVYQTAVRALAGRVARVSTTINGTVVQLLAAYAPVSSPHLRVSFMKRLRTYLNKNTILGIDANCVPDESLDIQRDANSPYDNGGANELASAV